MRKCSVCLAVLLGVMLLPALSREAGAEALSVSANQDLPGLNTGIDFIAGQTLTITASGEAVFGTGSLQSCSTSERTLPDGHRITADGTLCPPKIDPSAVLPSAPVGALLAKIGSSQWFAVGSSFSAPLSAGGRLFLLYNDIPGQYGNNSRSYQVTLECPPELLARGTCHPISRTPAGKAPDLVVLVHGCCTDADGVRNDWDSFGRQIAATIKTPTQWEVVVWDWHDDTPKHEYNQCPQCFPGDISSAYINAIDQSLELAIPITMNPKGAPTSYRYIHLIGHSAGARLIDITAKRLVDYYKTKNEKERPFIQLTFLDAYQPQNDDYGNLPGYSMYYAEQYVDRTGSVIGPLTNSCLPYAFNFDITKWPSNNPDVEKGDWGHQWPRYWYQKSIVMPGFSSYGYHHSFEGGFSQYEELAKVAKHKQCQLVDSHTDCSVPADCW